MFKRSSVHLFETNFNNDSTLTFLVFISANAKQNTCEEQEPFGRLKCPTFYTALIRKCLVVSIVHVSHLLHTLKGILYAIVPSRNINNICVCSTHRLHNAYNIFDKRERYKCIVKNVPIRKRKK